MVSPGSSHKIEVPDDCINFFQEMLVTWSEDKKKGGLHQPPFPESPCMESGCVPSLNLPLGQSSRTNKPFSRKDSDWCGARGSQECKPPWPPESGNQGTTPPQVTAAKTRAPDVCESCPFESLLKIQISSPSSRPAEFEFKYKGLF